MDKKSKCRFKGNQDGEIYINDLLLVAKWIAASLTGELTDDEYHLLAKYGETKIDPGKICFVQ